MRRKDRKVTDFNTILKIIDECEIIRLGFSDDNVPYIVPVNFAYTVNENKIEFYIHGAVAGRKFELMNKNHICSFEMDIPIKMECDYLKRDVTMRYKSVMGIANIDILNGDAKQYAMDSIIMNRFDLTRNFAYNNDMLAKTCVAKLTVIQISAKANLSTY